MKFLIAIIALAALVTAEEKYESKPKRAPVQSSKLNNALQEVQNAAKQSSNDGSAGYSLSNIESQSANANLQSQLSQQYHSQIPQQYQSSQIPQQYQSPQVSQQYQSQIPQHQPQFVIPAQYVQPAQSNLRSNIPYQFPQTYHVPSPVQMVIVPQPVVPASHQQMVPLSYSSNPSPLILTPHANMLFNQAAQQLLHYYQTNPQARLQLLQGYQPQYQFAPQPSAIGAGTTTHLAPSSNLQSTSALYHQSSQPSNLATTPISFQPIFPNYQHSAQPQIASQQQSQQQQAQTSSATSASTQSLNALEYLPQPEKLTASSASFLAPIPLRAPYKTRY